MVESGLILIKLCSTHRIHKQSVQEWRHSAPSDTVVVQLLAPFTPINYDLSCNHIMYRLRGRVSLPYSKANSPQVYEEEPVTPVVLSFINGEYPMAQVSASKAYPRITVVKNLLSAILVAPWKVWHVSQGLENLWNKTSWTLLVSSLVIDSWDDLSEGEGRLETPGEIFPVDMVFSLLYVISYCLLHHTGYMFSVVYGSCRWIFAFVCLNGS